MTSRPRPIGKISRGKGQRRIDRLRPKLLRNTALNTTEARAKISRLGGVLVVALLPATVILILIHFLFGATIFDSSFPTRGVWNDERYYWLQISTFSQHGFGGGYFTYEEVPSTSFSHFGAHGPIYPLLFGSIAHVVGWHYYSAALFHLIILTIAIAFYAYFTNLRGRQLVVAAFVYVTFWPLMFFTATSMEEGLHYTFACVFAIIFYHVAVNRRKLSWQAYVACILFFVLASLLRPTWAFLFLPFFVYLGARSPLGVVVSFIKAGLAILASFGLSMYLTAPYPYGFVANLRNTPGANGQLRLVGQNVLSNVRQFVTFESSRNSTALQGLQHAQLVAFFAVCCCVTLIAGRSFLLKHSKYRQEKRWLPRGLPEFPLFFHLVNLGAVIFTVLTLYDVGRWRDYRTIAPHMLLAILLLVTMQKRLWLLLPVAFVVSNVFFAPHYLQDFREHRASAYSNTPRRTADAFREAVAPELRYERNENPWCNTLLSSWPGGDALPLQIVGVPAGIGVSVVFRPGMTTPLKSKYLLASEQTYSALKEETDLSFITKTSYGNLYRNLDAKCEP